MADPRERRRSAADHVRLGHEQARQITRGDANERDPAWSPDGRLIALSRTREGPIAFLWSTMRLCGLLGSARWGGSDARLLIDVNEAWGEDRAWPDVALREFPGASGMKNVGLLMLPPGGGGGPVPLLVHVHGGPHASVEFGFTYRPYWYVLVSRGWAVLSLNPVGSAGQGKEFADRLRGRWGERDLPEHLAAIDELVAEGTIDGDRVAIAGKS
ncbi:prolyl oligopeptidase family serine peptidase [Sorangium sp. So ce204]|uniref:prolyl oligopeptidase family serine peptidase n=1 Tax=Sorangium sp. So ce204 TaxID=3133288 RepID=UPI003F609AF1